MGKIKQAIEKIYAGIVLHRGNREPHSGGVVGSKAPDLTPLLDRVNCKRCFYGTIRKNNKGRPKGYCLYYEQFTSKNTIACGAYCSAELKKHMNTGEMVLSKEDAEKIFRIGDNAGVRAVCVMTDEELYEALSKTNDIRIIFDGKVYSREDFEREHGAIRDAWNVEIAK